jgi:hypothetical protein
LTQSTLAPSLPKESALALLNLEDIPLLALGFCKKSESGDYFLNVRGS